MLFKQVKDGRKAKEAVLESLAPLFRSLAIETCKRLNVPVCYYSEIVESVTVNVFQGIETFRGENVAQFIEWTREIAKNAALGLKIEVSKKTRREVDLEALGNGACEKSKSPDQVIQTRQLMASMIRSLPVEDRIIFILKSLGEYTFSEIADILDISQASAQRKYVAVIKKLKEKFS